MSPVEGDILQISDHSGFQPRYVLSLDAKYDAPIIVSKLLPILKFTSQQGIFMSPRADNADAADREYQMAHRATAGILYLDESLD